MSDQQNKTNSLNQDSAGLDMQPKIVNGIDFGMGITVPETLEQYEYRKNVEAITSASKAEIASENKIRISKEKRNSIKKLVTNKQQFVGQQLMGTQLAFQQEIEKDYSMQNIQEIERLQTNHGITISQDIDVIALQDEVNDAIDGIAKTDGIETADDLAVSVTNSGGTQRLKFSVQRGQIPNDMNIINKMVSKFNGTIKSRPLDVRNVSAINSNYSIKDKTERLSACSLSFKPTDGSVNKATRIVISKPEDYNTSKNFILFMQHSRDKWIGTIDSKKFTTREDYLIFISNAIVDFFTIGFDVLEERLMMEKKGMRGLARVAEVIMKSGMFETKIRKYGDEITHIEIKTKKTQNQWLYVYIIPGTYKDTYEISLLSRADSDWDSNINLGSNLTINWLIDNIVEMMKNWYAKDWDADINLVLNNDKYMIDKFDRVKMRMAFQTIVDIRNQNPFFGIEIKKALSVADTNEIMPGNYGAETLIGKTEFVDYFVLTHLGYMIPESHSKSISPKTGKPNNNRKFVFQIEYAIKDVKCVYRADEFSDVLKDTGFLSDTPSNATALSKY